MNFNIFSKTKNAWVKLESGQFVFAYNIPKQLKKGDLALIYFKEKEKKYVYASDPTQLHFAIKSYLYV